MAYDVKNTIQKLFDDDGLREILLGVEEYFDNMDLYVFDNWIDGELVEGPIVSKYWVECTFKYQKEKMPDPRGSLLFLNQGTKITFKEDIELVPIHIPLSPDDIDSQTGKSKDKEVPIILVKFQIPRRLVDTKSVQEYEIMDQDDAQEADNIAEEANFPDDSMDGSESGIENQDMNKGTM